MIEFEYIVEENNLGNIRYSKFMIKRILSPFECFVDYLHTPIHSYNLYAYKAVWYNFIYIRPNTHTWFIKYPEEMKDIAIPRWFYEWWN